MADLIGQVITPQALASGGKKKRGRPKGSVSRDKWAAARGIAPATAAEILGYVVDERKTWLRLLTSDDDRVVLQAIVFLTSMRDGRPAQQINVTSQSIVIRANELERAREIVREIRGELATLQQPTKADASSHDITTSEPRLGQGEGKAKPMLREGQGANGDGDVVG